MGGNYIAGQPVTVSALNSSPVRINLDALFAGDVQPLRVMAQTTPNMTVQVAGDNNRAYVQANTPLNYSGGNSPTFVAPSSAGEKRIDLLHIDKNGVLTITQGTATTGTPTAPAYPGDKMVLAEIYLRYGATVIKNSDDTTNGYIFKNRTPLFNLGAAGVPAGSIVTYGNAAPPTGFLLADGSAVSRTTYADLFAIIGTTFGVGDGSTTFNLPNIVSSAEREIPKGEGTLIGNMTDNAGLAASFDGNTNQVDTSCSRGTINTNNTSIGKDWGASKTYKITKVYIYGSNNYGFNAGDPSYTLTLQGSTDNFSASIIDLDSITFTDTGNESAGKAITIPDITIGYYRYHRIKFTSNGTVNEQHCAEIRFFTKDDFYYIIKF